MKKEHYILLSLLLCTFLGVFWQSYGLKDDPKNNEKLKSKSKEITKIIDGDTFRMNIDGENTSIRLYGVDCAELRKKGSGKKRALNKEGQQARTDLEKLLSLYEIKQIEKVQLDHYKRSLSIVHLSNGDTVNEYMIKNGNCTYYPKTQDYLKNEFKKKLQLLSKNKICGDQTQEKKYCHSKQIVSPK